MDTLLLCSLATSTCTGRKALGNEANFTDLHQNTVNIDVLIAGCHSKTYELVLCIVDILSRDTATMLVFALLS